MGQVPPPKFFAPPLPYGASQANNIVSQSQPTAQAPQPAQPFINLSDPNPQQDQAQAPTYQQAPDYQQYQAQPRQPRNSGFYGGRNYYRDL